MRLLVLVGFVWIGAIIAGVASVRELDSALQKRAVVSEARQLMPRPIELRQVPAPASTYQAVAQTIHSSAKGIEVTPGPSSVTIQTRDPAAYEAWMLALNAAIAQAPDFRWTVKKLCAGLECPGIPFSATLTAAQIQTEVRK